MRVVTSDREGYSTSSDGDYSVVVACGLSHELALEGLARELVHLIQNMRRSAGFDIADYIIVYYQGMRNSTGSCRPTVTTFGRRPYQGRW